MAKKKANDEKRTCKMCVHHFDEHERGANGNFIVARCPFKKWCVLLNYPPDVCGKFKMI